MLSFLCVSVLALLLQYLIFMRVVTEVASELPHDGRVLMGEIPARLLWVLLVTAVLLLPSTLYVGVLATQRIFGPVYRLETHLKEVLQGKACKEVRLRKGDEFTELCALINQVTQTLPRQSSAPAAHAEPVHEDPRAAA